MKTKIHAFTLALCLFLSLCACQLATENNGADTDSGQLAGFLITTEPLGAIAYARNQENSSATQNDNTLDLHTGDLTEYNGRIYATLVDKSFQSAESGEWISHWQYEFPAGIGYAVFMAQNAEDMATGGITSTIDDGISNAHFDIYHGDEEDKYTIDATIYITPQAFALASQSGSMVYFNPVYQSSDARVYASSGTCFSCEGVSGEGNAFSKTLEETVRITAQSAAKTRTIKVTMSIATMFAPQEITILQMDTGGVCVEKNSYPPEETPAQIQADSKTEYIIVETLKYNRENVPIVTRDFFSKNDAVLSSYEKMDDGVCVSKYTEILWTDTDEEIVTSS